MTFLPQSASTEGRPALCSETDVLAARRARGATRHHGKHNLPHAASGFVGRQEETSDVGSLLRDFRLVTLTGPGGMGKTRLALEVAGRAAFRYPDGVWLAELGALAPTRLLQAVADALPGREGRARSADEVAGQIGRRHLLLVVDSCEHLLEATALLVEHLLRACPGLDVLVASREALGINGEHSWALLPLSLPDHDDVSTRALAASEAGELFVQRATEVNPRFRLTEANAVAVAEICRRLDGLPLAIELAALRVASLTPTDILSRLDDRFRLLATGSATAPVRHQTLLGALESSHELLSPAEAALLHRVSVFSGWSLRAAEQVCAGHPLGEADILDLLAALVAKSLVVVEAGEDSVRYRLLETVRLWAGSKLEAGGEADAVRRAHARWCVEVAESTDEELGGRHAKALLDELEVEHDNLRAALDWARDAGEVDLGLRLVTALARFWRQQGHILEGQRWMGWAVVASADAPPLLRAKALRAAGLLRGQLGDIVSALPLLDQSSALYAETGDHDASLCACHTTFLMTRNPRQALPVLEEKATLCRRNGDTNGLAHLLHSIGQVHYILCATDEARRCFQECLQLGRGAAEREALRSGLLGLARVDLLLGDLIAAEGWLAEALIEADEAGDDDDAALALGFLGEVARIRGQWERGRSLLTTSLDRARLGGMPIGIARAHYFLGRLAEAEGDATCGGLFDRSLSLAQAGKGPVFHEVRCLLGMGSAAELEGDLDGAAGHLLEAHELAQSVGDVVVSAEALHRLSIVASRQGKSTEASILGHRGLELYHRVGARPGVASALESIAGQAAGSRPEVAARLFAAAHMARDQQGLARTVPEQVRHDADLALVRVGLGPAAFEAAWADGAAFSIDEAVAYALRGRRARDRPASGWDSLTSAEREVVRLVIQGLSNPEVGRRLFISPRTVGHHLTHVFDKLGIRSRGALTKELAGREI